MLPWSDLPGQCPSPGPHTRVRMLYKHTYANRVVALFVLPMWYGRTPQRDNEPVP